MMDADAITQAVGAFNCACGRILQAGAVYCDACGQAVAYTDVTTRLDSPAVTGMTIPLPPPPATGATTRLHPPVIVTDPSEDLARLLAALREGMAVHAAEGERLGRIRRVCLREPEVYLHVMAEADWWKLWQGGSAGLYLPASAIAEVDTKRVLLTMDATTAKGCTWCPSWILPISPQEHLMKAALNGGGGIAPSASNGIDS